MNDATGHAMISQVASKMLAHAGFQGAQASALAVMTDITVEFFLNLGRTLRGYTDLYNKGMTAEVTQRLLFRYDGYCSEESTSKNIILNLSGNFLFTLSHI